MLLVTHYKKTVLRLEGLPGHEPSHDCSVLPSALAAAGPVALPTLRAVALVTTCEVVCCGTGLVTMPAVCSMQQITARS